MIAMEIIFSDEKAIGSLTSLLIGRPCVVIHKADLNFNPK